MAKRAFCVGINDYPYDGSDLNGCVNDANAWADLLIERQVRHRDARFTCSLCQAPLEVDWMIRSPLPGRPFGLNRQFGPHHFMVHTTLPTLVSTVQTV